MGPLDSPGQTGQGVNYWNCIGQGFTWQTGIQVINICKWIAFRWGRQGRRGGGGDGGGEELIESFSKVARLSKTTTKI